MRSSCIEGSVADVGPCDYVKLTALWHVQHLNGGAVSVV